MICGKDADDKGGRRRYNGCGRGFRWTNAPQYEIETVFTLPPPPTEAPSASSGTARSLNWTSALHLPAACRTSDEEDRNGWSRCGIALPYSCRSFVVAMYALGTNSLPRRSTRRILAAPSSMTLKIRVWKKEKRQGGTL